MSIPIRVPAPYLPNVRDLWVSSISTASLIFWLVRDKPAPCVYFMVLFYSFYSFFFFFVFLFPFSLSFLYVGQTELHKEHL